MLHRGMKFFHAAVLAFSAVLAFLFVRELDEDWVLGHSAVVWVNDSDGSARSEQVVRAIESFAAQRGVTVAREVPDLMDPSQRRHLYLATGGRGSDTGSWLTDFPRRAPSQGEFGVVGRRHRGLAGALVVAVSRRRACRRRAGRLGRSRRRTARRSAPGS